MFADPIVLARIQFGLNIGFHILFPTITSRSPGCCVYLRVRIGRGGPAVARRSLPLWVKIFALSFALGVVSGITMSFQFGTNWPGFMERAGNIAGPLLGYEVLTAFFLEATFLGVMLFGMTACRAGCTRSRRCWSRSAPRLGVLDPRAQLLDADARGASHRRRQAARRATGGRSSSTRASRTGSRTCCSPPG